MKRIFKWLALGVLGVVALVVLAAALFYFSDPWYVRRIVTFSPARPVTDVEWSAPRERVAGTVRDDLVVAPDGTRTIEPAALQQAIDYADSMHSVALVVWRDGRIELEKYWPGYDRDTLTDTASMHKPVMALLTGAAISDGLIPSVDVPAATWLKEWQGDARSQITLRNLLQMSSGLALIPFSRNPLDPYMKSLLGSDLNAIALSLSPAEPPGQSFEYSNMNSQLLGLVVQRAAGKRYAEYLSERLWSRLGAGDAWLWLDRPKGMPHTFCCLQTTARGWLRVGLLILNEGRVGDEQVVPASWVQEMTTPAPTNDNFGYQLWLGSPPDGKRRYSSKSLAVARHSDPFVAPDVRFIDGFGGQRVYVVPSQRLVIVRTGAPSMQWDDALLPNAILKGAMPLPESTQETGDE